MCDEKAQSVINLPQICQRIIKTVVVVEDNFLLLIGRI